MTKERLKKWLKLIKEYESPVSTFLGMMVVISSIVLIITALIVVRNTSFFSQNVVSPTTQPSSTPISQSTELPSSIYVYLQDGKYFVEGLPTKYVVTDQDTLEKIALAFFKSQENIQDILEANQLATSSAVYVGQELLIPNVPTRLSSDIIELEKESQ